MFIKITGMVLIMVSAYLLGLYWGSRGSFRLRELEELKKALNILRGEISFSRNPLGEAVKTAAERVDEPAASAFRAISERLAEKKEALNEIWADEFRKSAGNSHLNWEDIELVASFSANLGQPDRQTQERGLVLMMDEIENKAENLRAESEKSRKLFRSLGALGGLLVCIVLF